MDQTPPRFLVAYISISVSVFRYESNTIRAIVAPSKEQTNSKSFPKTTFFTKSSLSYVTMDDSRERSFAPSLERIWICRYQRNRWKDPIQESGKHPDVHVENQIQPALRLGC